MEARRRLPFFYVVQIFKLTTFLTVFLSIIICLNHINFSHYFFIHTIRVFGLNRVERTEIETILRPIVTKGFFSIDVDYIHDRLKQIPWVSDLSVRKIWPDKIDIILTEKNAIAHWNDLGLLSDGGEIFTPKQMTKLANIPKFYGPLGQQMMMLHYFKDINRLLRPIHAKIYSLELTPYFTWNLKLDNGMKLHLGHKDILTRLNHFVKVYPKIVGAHGNDVDYIDLRYPNGVAVRWNNNYGKEANK